MSEKKVDIRSVKQIFQKNTKDTKFHVRVMNELVDLHSEGIAKLLQKERQEKMKEMETKLAKGGLKQSHEKDDAKNRREDFNSIIQFYSYVLLDKYVSAKTSGDVLKKTWTKFVAVLEKNEELKKLFKEHFDPSLAIFALNKEQLRDKICTAMRILIWSVWNHNLDGKTLIKYFTKEGKGNVPTKDTLRKESSSPIKKQTKTKKKKVFDRINLAQWLKKNNSELFTKFEADFE
jgi:hypothetical protein